jgi:hypothetical protein
MIWSGLQDQACKLCHKHWRCPTHKHFKHVRWVSQLWREARAMTWREVITKAIAKQLSWVKAAEIKAVTPRQLRRIRWGWNSTDSMQSWTGAAGDRAASG